jgi:hypothetical protein
MRWSAPSERKGGLAEAASSQQQGYDTEGWAPAVPQQAEITTFVNFSSFNTAGLSLSKAFGRDTNLQGQNGLPAAHHHLKGCFVG